MNTFAKSLNIIRLSDTGKLRHRNEDTVASDLSIGFAMLADGMGGYNAGDIASQMAALTITAELKTRLNKAQDNHERINQDIIKDYLIEAVNVANQAILKVSQEQQQCAGMGTTLVATLFIDNHVVIGHIGDSRAYRLRQNTLKQITNDHSLIQEHIDSGFMNPEDAQTASYKNYLTKALGVSQTADLEINTFSVEPKDIYLLCSDGLTDMLSDAQILTTLLENNTLSGTANALIQKANQQGGNDNISVILIEVIAAFTLKKSNWLKTIINKVVK